MILNNFWLKIVGEINQVESSLPWRGLPIAMSKIPDSYPGRNREAIRYISKDKENRDDGEKISQTRLFITSGLYGYRHNVDDYNVLVAYNM